jgi:hypothetical protein
MGAVDGCGSAQVMTVNFARWIAQICFSKTTFPDTNARLAGLHFFSAVRFSKATAPAKSGGKGMFWIAH